MSKLLEEKVAPEFVIPYLLERFSIAGTPEECAARVRELEKAGVKRLMLTPPEKVFTQMMEAWAKEVSPRVSAG